MAALLASRRQQDSKMWVPHTCLPAPRTLPLAAAAGFRALLPACMLHTHAQAKAGLLCCCVCPCRADTYHIWAGKAQDLGLSVIKWG